jgi:hypothetical protein
MTTTETVQKMVELLIGAGIDYRDFDLRAAAGDVEAANKMRAEMHWDCEPGEKDPVTDSEMFEFITERARRESAPCLYQLA